MMSIPFLYKQILDLLTKRDIQMFYTYIGLLCILLLSHIFALLMKQTIARYAIIDLLEGVRNHVLDHFLSGPYKTVKSFHSGDVSSRLSKDLEEVKSYWMLLSDSLYQGAVFLFAIVYGLMISAELLCITFGVLLLAMFASKKISKPLAKESKSLQEHFSKRNTIIKETIQGIRSVKAYQLEETMMRKHESSNIDIVRQEDVLVRKQVFITMIQVLLMIVPMQIINLYGGFLTFSSQISMGDFGLFLAIITYFINPVSYGLNLYTTKKRASASMDRLEELSLTKEETKNSLTSKDGDVLSLKDVSFSYGKERVLHEVNLSLPNKSLTMIFGESGSGKSTIFSLISKRYKVSLGQIQLFGQDIKDLDLYPHIALASSDLYIYPISIKENIGLADKNATNEDIVQAAKDAHIHDFILSLVDGYNTLLKDNGGNLSGGQRARILLARAFLKPASLLLLDEPTSALDKETEEKVLQSIKERKKTQCVLMITHQENHAKLADRSFYLKKGNLQPFTSPNQTLQEDNNQPIQYVF